MFPFRLLSTPCLRIKIGTKSKKIIPPLLSTRKIKNWINANRSKTKWTRFEVSVARKRKRGQIERKGYSRGIRVDLRILLPLVSAFSALCRASVAPGTGGGGRLWLKSRSPLESRIESLVLALHVLRVAFHSRHEVGRFSCFTRSGMDPALFNVLEFFSRSILDIGGRTVWIRTIEFDERPFRTRRTCVSSVWGYVGY